MPVAIERPAAPDVEQTRALADRSGRSRPVLDSARLLQGESEVLIRHGDELYRLRHTRNDRLILTK